MQAVHAHLAEVMGMSDADLQETVKSGQQTKFNNRVSWTRTYFGKALVIEIPRRGVVRITPRGLAFLQAAPEQITKADLMQFAEFAAFTARRASEESAPPDSKHDPAETAPPDEQIAALHASLNASLATDLLKLTQSLLPQQFEILVVQLLVKMGYGGSVRDAGQALGRSGDNGVDGLIKQDPLGLDRIYLQAKRWQNTVHSPEIRTFSGSLTYHKATKGVFITTSGFSDGARKTAAQIGNIILIDGETLAQLMIEYGVGVLTRETYLIRRVDSEFFEEL